MFTMRLFRYLLLWTVLLGLALPQSAFAQAVTNTTVASLTNPSQAGNAVNFTATVSSALAGVAGTVQFSSDGTPFGTPQAVIAGLGNSATTGQVSRTFATSEAGPHTVTAVFTPTAPATFAPSSGSVNQIVKANPAVAVGVGPASPVFYGTPLTFSATITGGFGTPTGTVQFQLNGSPLGPAVNVNGSGQAFYTTSTLPAGTYPAAGPSFSALYSGDSFNLSAGGNLATDYTVNKAAATVGVNTSNNNVAYGQPVTFTANVANGSGGGGTPTGSVTFTTSAGGVTLGTASLSSGTATLTSTSVPPGVGQTITASYSGDGNFQTGSGTVAQTIGPAPTSTAVTSSQNPSTLGTGVTLTATISSPAGAPTTGSVQFSDGTTSIGSGTNAGGNTWTLAVNLGVGPHSITAAFTPADATIYSGSTSSSLTQQVNPQGSSVSLGSSNLTARFGEAITFTAQVAGGGAAISGTVQLLNGNSVLSTVSVGGSGTAVFQISSLPITGGTPDSITAVYSGNGNLTNSSSAPLSQNIIASDTQTILNVPAGATVGQPVTLVAAVTAVAPGGGVPTGSVLFQDVTGSPGVTLGSGAVALDNNGNATITTSALPVGARQIQATYIPLNGNYNGSSATQTLTVSPAGTPVTVTATPNPSANGQDVLFTATVSGTVGGAAPTGTVDFSADGAAPFGTGTLTANAAPPAGSPPTSAATVTFAGLPVGTHTITATYNPPGGSPYATGSGSLTGGQTVAAASTGTTLQSSPNPSSFSQPVQLTATVTTAAPGAGTPVGSVTFLDTDGTQLGISNVTGTVANTGTAQFTVSNLSVGTHSITAKFVPSGSPASFSASTSAPASQTVGKSATATALVAAPSPSTFGQSVAFTATVTVNSGVAPSGTVTFQDTDGTTLATASQTAGSNPATFTANIASLAAGTHTITAIYSGDAVNAASAGPVTQNVNAAATTTSVVSSAPTSTFGQPVSFTASVKPNAPGSGVPTGSVTFTDTVGGTTSTLGTSALDGNGNAAFSTTGTGLSAGTHTITATYNPANGNDAASAGTVVQTVNQAASNISLQASPAPAIFGQNVTLTAVVVGTGGVAPTGKVTFTTTSGSTTTPLGSATLASSGTNGQGQPTSTAVLTTSALPASTADVLTASYPGDASNSGGSNTFAIRVDAASTNTAVKSSVNPSTFNQTVTFTATVTSSAPSGAIPAGTVAFSDTSNGKTTALGTAVIDQNGQGTFSLSSLAVGVHIITAAYTGSSNFQGSSNTLNQQVFEQQAIISSFSPAYLLVPGTVRDANHPILRVSDSQPLTITGQNFRSNATVFVNGVAVSPSAVSTDGTQLTLAVPPAAVATAGFAPIQVVNSGTAAGANGAPTKTLPVNPAAVLTNLPAASSSSLFLRMFSVPYDYTGQNPYDILQEVTLSPTLDANGYNPDVNLLSSVGLSSTLATDPGYLAFDRWDPSLLQYLTTAPPAGRKADNVQFLLGQAFWVVGGTNSQLLGLMRIGAPAGLNPTGIPLVKGWNMIGNPFPADTDLSTLAVLPVQGATLPFYSPSASQPDSAVYEGIVSPIFWSWNGTAYVANHPPQPDSPNAPHVLRAYEGYWLYSYQQCTLLVNNARP